MNPSFICSNLLSDQWLFTYLVKKESSRVKGFQPWVSVLRGCKVLLAFYGLLLLMGLLGWCCSSGGKRNLFWFSIVMVQYHWHRFLLRFLLLFRRSKGRFSLFTIPTWRRYVPSWGRQRGQAMQKRRHRLLTRRIWFEILIYIKRKPADNTQKVWFFSHKSKSFS